MAMSSGRINRLKSANNYETKDACYTSFITIKSLILKIIDY